MRHKQYTITPQHVHAHACRRIQQHVRLADHGPKCKAGVLWAVLFWAASRISSLAAACASLRDAPSDSAAHDALVVSWEKQREWLAQSGSQKVIRDAWIAADDWAHKDNKRKGSKYLWNQNPNLLDRFFSKIRGAFGGSPVH